MNKFYVAVVALILIVVCITIMSGNLSSAAQAQASIEQSHTTQLAIGSQAIGSWFATLGDWLQNLIILALVVLLLRERITRRKVTATHGRGEIQQIEAPRTQPAALPAGDGTGDLIDILKAYLAMKIAMEMGDRRPEIERRQEWR